MVRKIQHGDAAAVKYICETALGHETSVELLEQRILELADDPAYYIAVAADETSQTVKGFIQAEKYNLLYGGNGWNIIALAVARDAQKQGFGKALLQSLEAHAAARGDTFVRLNSRSDRADAHGFYEHFGYDCDKLQKRFIKVLD